MSPSTKDLPNAHSGDIGGALRPVDDYRASGALARSIRVRIHAVPPHGIVAPSLRGRLAMSEQVQHVSDTALLAAGWRAMESSRPDALFHDPLAADLAGERGLQIAR